MTEGHCLCRAVTWRFEGEPTWSCYCHCESCRRNCAAPATAFLGVPLNVFQWTGAEPATYESSKGVRRRFCGVCGTPVAFEADHYPGEIHLYAAGLADPQDFAPSEHVHYEEPLKWLHIEDDLPRKAGFSNAHNS